MKICRSPAETGAMSMPIHRSVFAVAVLLFSSITSVSAIAKEHVLIIGGAGNTGSIISKMLIARGDDVTAFVRSTTDRFRLEGVPVNYVVGDAMKADEVAAALEGKSYTVILDNVQLLEINEQQSYTSMYANFVPWAKRMGVKQFIVLGGACSERPREDCPLSPPLYKVAADQTIAEYILRGAGVPYTVFRIGALFPGGPDHPDAGFRTGTSFLSTNLSLFGAIWRGDFYDHIFGCIGRQRCINEIFTLDDPSMKPKLDNWLCKRRYESDTINFFDPRCGEEPPLVLPHAVTAPE